MEPFFPAKHQAGYVLVPVMLLLVLVALAAFLLSYEGGIGRYLTLRRADPEKALYVAEAGLQLAAWQVQQAECENYADIGATPLGEHSFAATVSPHDSSPVDISATGTLASGLSRTVSQTGMTVYEPPVTMILQPDADNMEDTRIYEWKPTWNYGVSTQLGVDTYWSDSRLRSLLRFDLQAIPVSAKILSAVLELHSVSSSDNGGPVAVHRVTADWDEGAQNQNVGPGANWTESSTGVLWTSAGGDFEPVPVTVTNVPGSTIGWHSWDITSLVDKWIKGTYPNQGLLLDLQEDNRGTYFFSSDYSVDPAKRPKLTITMACECGGGPEETIILQLGTDPGKDANVDSFYADRNFGGDYGRVSGPPSTIRHQLYFFDLAAIPGEATIVSAELAAYAYWVDDVAPGMAISAHQLTRDWIEGTGTGGGTPDGVTWNTYDGVNPWASPGGDFDPVALASVPVLTSTDQWFSWPITPLVGQWLADPSSNHGVLLKGEGDVEVSLADTDYNVPAQKPKLTVTYSCPCGIDCTSAPAEEFCDADFTPTAKVGEFSTVAVGTGKPHGLTYLPDGTTFNGVAAPAGGALLIIDSDRDLFMSTLSGSPLSSCNIDVISPLAPKGITFVQSGTWAGHLAVAGNLTNDEVVIFDLDCNLVTSFPTVSFGSNSPTGISYIGTTASGTHEEHLAVADDDNDAVYIIDQAGSLQATLDLSLFIDRVHGVAHLPGSDKLLLADEATSHAFIIDFVNFSGAPLVDYDAGFFGVASPSGVVINPMTCDHELSNDQHDKVVALNTGAQGGLSMTLIPTIDTWVYMNSPDTNYGGSTLMQAGANAGWDYMNTLVEFDLAAIPAGANVMSATLRLYAGALTGNKPQEIGLYRVTADWAEGTQNGSGTADGATWNTSDGVNPWTAPGGDFDPAPLVVPTVDWSIDWKEWPVPPGLIHEWIDGVTPNHGLLLYYQGIRKNFFLKFATREHSDPLLRPQLVIEYTED